MLTNDQMHVINIWSVDEGVWSSGMTEVSKTFSGGSIPSTPVKESVNTGSFFVLLGRNFWCSCDTEQSFMTVSVNQKGCFGYILYI